MRPETFHFVAGLVKSRSGLALNADKAYLVETRLQPLARQYGLVDVEALVQLAQNGRAETLLSDITEAMTTNESYFFRDTRPFDWFRKSFLPDWVSRKVAGRGLRVWSAACSTGQEPYSLAMILAEEQKLLEGTRTEIMATDIAPRVLEKAREGRYSQFEVQRGVPIQGLLRHFEQKEGGSWQIKPELRQAISFREFNLLSPFDPLGTFDLIFCRNVLIYFDETTKQEVLKRLHSVLAPGAYLVLGATETTLGLSAYFVPAENAAAGVFRAA